MSTSVADESVALIHSGTVATIGMLIASFGSVSVTLFGVMTLTL